jgi:hypothetical protein
LARIQQILTSTGKQTTISLHPDLGQAEEWLVPKLRRFPKADGKFKLRYGAQLLDG